MPNDGTKITAPIGFGDIQRVLKIGYNDIGNIIRYGNINMFSRKKPVILDQIFTTNYPSWWKAKDGYCGITIPETTFTTVENANWTYARPTGGITAPFRTTDFENYYHAAKPPIVTGYSPGSVLEVDLNLSGQITLNSIQYPPSDEGLELQMQDFIGGSAYPALSDCYYAVILWPNNKASQSTYYIITSDQQLKSGACVINLNFNATPLTGIQTEYKACFAITDTKRLQQSGQPAPARFWPIFNDANNASWITIKATKNRTIDVHADAIATSVTATHYPLTNFGTHNNPPYTSSWNTFYGGTGSLSLRCTVTNLTNSALTLDKSEFYVSGRSVWGIPVTELTGLYNASFSQVNSLTVPANSSVTVYLFCSRFFYLDSNGQSTIPGLNAEGNYNYQVTVGGGSKRGGANMSNIWINSR